MSARRNANHPKISVQEVEVTRTSSVQLAMKTPGNSPKVKRIKLNNSTPSAPQRNPSIVLNTTMIHRIATNRDKGDKGIHLVGEDFFLKNENNNCFYKCVLCSETVKSKPCYKSHMRTMHDTDLNKHYIQKGFVDATKGFCMEFVQTDFNIIQLLTSIFDQIDNVERIIRDHKKRFANGLTDKFLNDEAVVLKLCGEMIQRAFDILSEKN